MSRPPSKTAMPQTKRENAQDTRAGEWGWYLYGITTRQTASRLTTTPPPDASEALQTEGVPIQGVPIQEIQALEQGELAALIRPVPLDEFSAEAIRARAQDLAWLEAMVREHNQIVERIHQAGTVLPVKFGSVYPNREALRAALAGMHDALLAQLQRLQGCDEWGVHLFAGHQAIQRLAGAHPTLQRFKDTMAAASPGRAYLLKRKLADEMAALTEEVRSQLAQASYERLARYAVAGQITPRPQKPDEADEHQVLHATFLVQRTNAPTFLAEAQRLIAEQEGLRCEYSGPWPPYSFARPAEEDS